MDKISLGRQFLVELYDCCPKAISDLKFIRESMVEAANLSKATIVNEVFHEFNPHGFSGVVVIAESHFAIHTWPEYGVVSIDIFSCSSKMCPELGITFLRNAFKANKIEIKEVQRGQVEVARLDMVAASV
jgi:S-adenosylmethionine decarboxylase proenzyme